MAIYEVLLTAEPEEAVLATTLGGFFDTPPEAVRPISPMIGAEEGLTPVAVIIELRAMDGDVAAALTVSTKQRKKLDELADALAKGLGAPVLAAIDGEEDVFVVHRPDGASGKARVGNEDGDGVRVEEVN